MAEVLLHPWMLWSLIAAYFAAVFSIAIRRKKVPMRALWYGIAGYILLVAGRIVGGSILIHNNWSADEGLSKYYTTQYSGKIFELAGNAFIHLSIALGIGLIIGLTFYFVKRKKDVLLEDDEILLLSFGSAIAGWPNVFIYVGVIFILTLIRKLLLVALKKESASDRIVILPAVPLAAIIILFWGNQLAVWTGIYGIR